MCEFCFKNLIEIILTTLLLLVAVGCDNRDEERKKEEAKAKKYNEDNPGWYSSLPDCPCINPDQGGVVEGDGWASEGTNSYHPCALECFRSYPDTVNGLVLDGPGQQCCYDSLGNLITAGQGAGTPDRANTTEGEDSNGKADRYWRGVINHYGKDVVPADILDPEVYNKYWPPNNGNDCRENRKPPC